MTDRERKNLIKEIGDTAKKVSKSASEGKELLFKAGIHTPKGKLSAKYK